MTLTLFECSESQAKLFLTFGQNEKSNKEAWENYQSFKTIKIIQELKKKKNKGVENYLCEGHCQIK